MPLTYRIEPRGLKVLIPPPADGESAVVEAAEAATTRAEALQSGSIS